VKNIFIDAGNVKIIFGDLLKTSKSLLTALYGLCVVRKSFVTTGLPSVLILKVLCKKYFKVSKIHKSLSDGYFYRCRKCKDYFW
jgi:hypothetical protein